MKWHTLEVNQMEICHGEFNLHLLRTKYVAMKQRLLCGITLYCKQTFNGETKLESKGRTKINVAILTVLKGVSPEYLLTEKKILPRT
jgi:hypothetical protein